MQNTVASALFGPRREVGPGDTSYLLEGGARQELVDWLLLGLTFLIAAALCVVLLPSGHALDPAAAIVAVVLFVVACQFELRLSSGWVGCQQAAFVVLLFAFPLNVVPAVACGSLLVAQVIKRRPLRQLPGAAGDSWYTLPPVLVLAAMAPGRASWNHWPAYVVAFVAEFVVVEALQSARFAVLWERQVSLRDDLQAVAVDTMLTPIGLMAAVTMRTSVPATAVTLAAVTGLLAFLTYEHVKGRTHAERALRDTLTGLANRALFAEALAACALRCDRQRTHAGLLLLDLDDFKLINDTFGHQIGDEVLATFAARVTAATRTVDVAARLGGDEFAVILTEPMSAEGAEAVAANVRAALDDPVTLSGGEKVRIRASIGTAVLGDGISAADAMTQADRRLYEDKGTRKPSRTSVPASIIR